MALPNNKKLSIIYTLKILQEFSDETHILTQEDIRKILYSKYGMECERKSIGASIDSLIDCGYDIIKTPKGCFLASRELESSEITFLIDAIFSSKMISSKQAKDLANKLSLFTSKYKRKKYNYLFKADEISRSNNQQLFYNIDIINEAIEKNKQIKFTYNKYGLDGKLKPRQNRRDYLVNPYFMVNSQGKYYLVCNYDYFNEISNYKIEQITNIQIVDNPIKPIKQLEEAKSGFSISNYINENIYMFSGKSINAQIKLEKEEYVTHIYEWFGNNAKIFKSNNDVIANIYTNEESLIYWCIQYGDIGELISPIETREKIINELQKIYDKYN